MIRVTKLADYGILLMTWLAWRKARPGGDELRRSAADLARETGLPAPTVSKLLRLLSRAELLEAQRGAQGGYQLTRDPAGITVANIIEAIEGPIALMDCLDDTAPDCDVQSLCPTRTNWDRINQAILTALSSISLEEMATPQRGWRERMSSALTPTVGETS
ncbi:MAG: SUF system Fe-S cluster assembly regulator [Planctomycetota bacterium]|nr:SUF system Fe-S cluster assembly regulator [Planctomycetota bacterium]